MIDHAKLLEKYIRFVGNCEGVNFIDNIDVTENGENATFTQEEADELYRIDSEIYYDIKSKEDVVPDPIVHLPTAEILAAPQFLDIWRVMRDGNWWTIDEISKSIGHTKFSISTQLAAHDAWFERKPYTTFEGQWFRYRLVSVGEGEV